MKKSEMQAEIDRLNKALVIAKEQQERWSKLYTDQHAESAKLRGETTTLREHLRSLVTGMIEADRAVTRARFSPEQDNIFRALDAVHHKIEEKLTKEVIEAVFEKESSLNPWLAMSVLAGAASIVGYYLMSAYAKPIATKPAGV